jgi:hypothetical protein
MVQKTDRIHHFKNKDFVKKESAKTFVQTVIKTVDR